MAREKYKTLTEQMFYILICLKKERCGIEIMDWVADVTKNRVTLGPGTLYALIGDFVKEDIIKETSAEGRRRNYIITDKGLDSLLLLKDEAKKRLPINVGYISTKLITPQEEQNQISRMQREISRLENENAIMKKRLKKLLNISD